MSRIQELKKNFRHVLLPLILISFIIPLVIGGISFLNQWKNIQENQKYLIRSGFRNAIEVFGEGAYADAADIYVCVSTAKMNSEAASLQNIFVYDKNSDTVTPADADITCMADRLKAGNPEAFIKDGIFHVFYDNGSFIVHGQVTTGSMMSYLKDNILRSVVMLFAGFVLSAFLLCLIYFIFKNKKARSVLYYVITCIWLLAFSVLTAIPTIEAIFLAELQHVGDIYSMAESTTKFIADEISEGRQDMFVSDIDDDDADHKAYIEAHSDGTVYSEILADCMYDFARYSDYVKEISYGDDILDTSIPIIDRISFVFDYNTILDKVLEMLIQCIMLVMLALVLIKCIRLRLDQQLFENKEDSIYHGTMRMRILVICKCFIDSLTAVAFVPVLQQMLKADSVKDTKAAVSWIIFAVGMIGVLLTVLIPYFRKRMRSSVAYFRTALIISLVGAAVCFLSPNSIWYVAGYFVLAIGDGLAGMIFILYPADIPNQRTGLKVISFFSSGRLVGQIVGFVVSGLLSYIIGNKNMFMVVGILLILTFGISFFVPTSNLAVTVPLVSTWKTLFCNKKVIVFCVLMLVPFGFINYFFKYQIPISVSNLGLTTTLVAFIFFIRYFCMFFFRQSTKLKVILKKFKPLTIITVNMIQVGVLFILFCVFSNPIVLIVITIILAIIQTKFSSYMSIYNYESAGNVLENFFGLNTVRVIGTKTGSTIAPLISGFAGLITLPIIMIVFTLIHLFVTKKMKE